MSRDYATARHRALCEAEAAERSRLRAGTVPPPPVNGGWYWKCECGLILVSKWDPQRRGHFYDMLPRMEGDEIVWRHNGCGAIVTRRVEE